MRKILFITTKNIDYIRNTQEINIIKGKTSAYKIIGSNSKSYLKRLLHVYTKLIFTNVSDYDVAFVGFAPQLIIPLFWHQLRNMYIVEDFFVSIYDTFCCDRKYFKPAGITGKFLHHIDERTINAASLCICDTNAHGDYFANEFHADKSRMRTLYLEADTSIYHPMNVPKPDKYGGKFLVCYFGSILPLQGVDVILDAFKMLQNEENITLLCIGPLKYRPHLSNVDYIDWLPQEELARCISYCDLCLAGHFNNKIDKARRTIPGKAYIYQAMKKPMILGDNPANRELFSESDMASFVEMGNAEALAETVKRYYCQSL
jgi:glycosyltransferase involved in cell wall biosynthesis